MTPAHVATIVFFCTCGLFLAATGLWLIRQKSASALTERRLRHFTERENDLQSVNPIVRDNAVGACGDEANSGPVDTLRKWFVQAAIEMSPAQFGMVALIVSSTAGLEACVARKPLVCLRIPGLSVDDFYSDYGAVLEFSLEGEGVAERLAQELGRLRESVDAQEALADGRSRLLDDRVGGARGDAAERAAAVLHTLLQDVVS